MNLETNLKGRLRNTRLPLTSALLPLFEAIVNAIHSIEEKGVSMENGVVRVEIRRKLKDAELFADAGKKRGPDARDEIEGFSIEDNGIGFNDENLKSFSTLDSDHKLSKGGRGVGRLLWLKAFKFATVESVFHSPDGIPMVRKFRFESPVGVVQDMVAPADAKCVTGTTLRLHEFDSQYRAYSPKTARAIGDAILEHCLWYYLRPGGAPELKIIDGEETFNLSALFEEHMHTSAALETVQIKGKLFELVHARVRSNSLATHTIAFCADQRLVVEEKLAGRIPGLHGRIPDEGGGFVYSCYVSSGFLDAHTRPERTGFDIVENVDGVFGATQIGFKDIRECVVESARVYLKEHIEANKVKARERVVKFVSERAPRYRPILSRIPEDQLNVDPAISDRDLDLALHKQFAILESELLAEGHDIMIATPGEKFGDYEARIRSYLKKADDLKKSDLASYVSHRRVILDLFAKAIQRTAEGKYVREDLIHELIMPMRCDSNTVSLNAGNLWMIDERLAFHDYLASDKTLRSMPITGSNDAKEPDICVLNVFDQPMLFSDAGQLPPASLEIIEIKRPVRDDAASGEDKDPIEQAIGYLDRIRAGNVYTAAGRPIPASQNTPGFCYILADLTPSLIARCRMHDLTRTSDGMGYFGYKKNSEAYVEVIGFDRLLRMAKERNKAFFDKLGLPSN